MCLSNHLQRRSDNGKYLKEARAQRPVPISRTSSQLIPSCLRHLYRPAGCSKLVCTVFSNSKLRRLMLIFVGSSSPIAMLLHILLLLALCHCIGSTLKGRCTHVSLTSSALPCESRDDEIFGQSYKYIRVRINMNFSGMKSMTTLNIFLFRVQKSQKKRRFSYTGEGGA